MQETKQEVKATSMSEFLQLALGSVKQGVEDLQNKGVGIRFDKDFSNAIVQAFHAKPQFSTYSESEIKLALQPLFKGIIMNTIAKELQVVQGD